MRVAIAGVTGAVGEEFLRVLEKRNFPVSELRPLASARSAGKTIQFRGKEYTVGELRSDSFKGMDLALFSAGGSVSRAFRQAVVESGAVMVDNSSAFRMDPDVPLVVPEINPADIKIHKGVIANPNCSTIILLMAVYPVMQLAKVSKIIVSTYQASSGAGAQAMQELESQARQHLSGEKMESRIFPFPLAFNAFSHNSAMDVVSGLNQEEEKMVKETYKILHSDSMDIQATCVRIGTLRAHAESIYLETDRELSREEITAALQHFPGVQVEDDRKSNRFPMPLVASGQDDVFVGRIRSGKSKSGQAFVNLFCCGDQILKGAALNAVQIAEKL
ncbi:MAG: aspartate-semialdehyde dehydrogenase [Spirochaetales bacterium]|nr:aspartate-semialdehyde dehydrogenase [Spirochaetales bacterium]